MDEMDDVLKRNMLIDLETYARVALQAREIKEALMDETTATHMAIGIANRVLILDITHVDVLNELYCMLDNLQKLSDE